MKTCLLPGIAKMKKRNGFISLEMNDEKRNWLKNHSAKRNNKFLTGFTLVEILIVVAILGILAAIVIPHYTSASEEAKLSALSSSLQAIRAQVELYKTQHGGTYAGLTTANFTAAMTGYTDASGAIVAAGTPGALGPYLHKIPANPFDNISTVYVGSADDTPNESGGWFFNSTTGAFNANDTDHMTL